MKAAETQKSKDLKENSYVSSENQTHIRLNESDSASTPESLACLCSCPSYKARSSLTVPFSHEVVI